MILILWSFPRLVKELEFKSHIFNIHTVLGSSYSNSYSISDSIPYLSIYIVLYCTWWQADLYTAAHNIPYVEWVLQESFRVYPPIQQWAEIDGSEFCIVPHIPLPQNKPSVH